MHGCSLEDMDAAAHTVSTHAHSRRPAHAHSRRPLGRPTIAADVQLITCPSLGRDLMEEPLACGLWVLYVAARVACVCVRPVSSAQLA